MNDDIKALRDILPRVGEPERAYCCVEGGLLHRPLGRLEAAEKDAARYRWLRDKSVPPHNFYLSVPVEFFDVHYTRSEVDAAIDAAMQVRP